MADRVSKGETIKAVGLDLAKSEKKIWLVKVPPFVAQKWHAACESSLEGDKALGQELGTVKIQMDPSTAKTNCTLELPGGDRDIPQNYNMRQTSGDASCIYSFGEEPGLICVNGKVHQRFDVEMRQGQTGQAAPELDPSYRKLSRDRTNLAATKTRTAQVIDHVVNPQSISRVQQTGRAYASMTVNKRRWENNREKKVVDKRVRIDKEALENLLFKLFERQDFWNFQNLVKETDQPVAWLKECLLEIAVQNKAPGLHKDQWQLKPEYRIKV